MRSVMQDYYNINITLNGKHFCAIDSCDNIFQLRKVLPVVLQKFPLEEGYNITVTHWEGRGYEQNLFDLMEDD